MKMYLTHQRVGKTTQREKVKRKFDLFLYLGDFGLVNWELFGRKSTLVTREWVKPLKRERIKRKFDPFFYLDVTLGNLQSRIAPYLVKEC